MTQTTNGSFKIYPHIEISNKDELYQLLIKEGLILNGEVINSDTELTIKWNVKYHWFDHLRLHCIYDAIYLSEVVPQFSDSDSEHKEYTYKRINRLIEDLHEKLYNYNPTGDLH